MLFKGLDFDADKPKMYAGLKKMMAQSYEVFGPVSLTEFVMKPDMCSDQLKDIKETIKTEKEVILKGKNRIQEKIRTCAILKCFLAEEYKQNHVTE